MPRRLIIRTLIAAALAMPLPVVAQDGTAGPYLAARLAGGLSDYDVAAEYYDRLIALGNMEPRVLDSAMITYGVLGQFDKAADVAELVEAAGGKGQLTTLVRGTDLLDAEDYDAVLAMLDDGGMGGPLLDGLLRGWVTLAGGNMSGALEAFESVKETNAFVGFANLHSALALAMVGDLEGADRIFSGEAGEPLQMTGLGIAAHAQVLVQLDRRADAVELLTQTLARGRSIDLEALLAQIEDGSDVAFNVVRTPREGMAEVFYGIAAVVSGEAAQTYTLLHTQAALAMNPTHVEAILLTADILERQGNYDLAERALSAVPTDHPAYFSAEVARAQVLLEDDKSDASVEVLQALTRSHGDRAEVHAGLGDVLRRLERFEEAGEAYSAAIARSGEPEARDWFLYYARAITYERTDRWDEAEADFRLALQLNPEQPNVLNYLGYSLVEQKRNLDEALDMIERAVAARPDSGYITDSLGWVLFRLGRFDEAVEPMERAVELLPLDPVINDHLGDVYWAVGRKLEAEFQWSRALSFLGPDDEDHEAKPDRIRRKLEVGLDVVLEEEGAQSLADKAAAAGQ